MDLLGITAYERPSEELARAQMPVTAAVMQPYGIVHGGAYAALAETVTSRATYEVVGPELGAFGQANDTSFLRPVCAGTDARRGAGPPPRADELGLGGRDARRRGAALRALAGDDRGSPAQARLTQALLSPARSAAEAVGDRQPAIAAERLRRDLHAGRGLAPLVLGPVDERRPPARRPRGRSRRRPCVSTLPSRSTYSSQGPVEDLVGRQRVGVALVGPQLGRRRSLDHRTRERARCRRRSLRWRTSS